MVYYKDDDIVIRNLQESDAQIITDEEIAQGWHVSVEKYETRLKHQDEGKSISLVAEYKGKVAGYINIYPNSTEGAFANKGYGSAQRMYVKRGYIPDGSGVWYGESICEQYAECCNDDDLILYFSKHLK